jgi:hypothetical protein
MGDEPEVKRVVRNTKQAGGGRYAGRQNLYLGA